MSIDDRPTIAAPDDDPYLWLEEIEGERALAFVEQQKPLTLQKFGDAGFAGDRDALADILDRPDNIPFISRRGGFVYNLWKDANNPRGLWRRTTLAEFRKPDPAWETILDIDRLAAEENEDWLFAGAQALPDSGARILSLSRGGSDAAVLREFDVETKAFVAGGFTLPEAKGGAAWIDADTLLLSSAYGEGMATTSGYARTVRLWRRGTDVRQAPVLFETAPEHMACYASVDRTGATPRVWFIEQLDFFNRNIWLGDEAGARQKLDLPTDAEMDCHRRLARGEAARRRGRSERRPTRPTPCSACRCRRFLAGERDFQILFEAGPRRALQHFFWTAGKLVLSILDELRPVFEVWTPAADGWTRGKLPGLPEIGVVDVWRLDADEAESNGDLLANIQDPLTPASLMLIEGIAAPVVLKRAPRTFSAEGLVVTQHEAISIDGERIPYVQTGPAAETGDAPVHLNAYGGFGISVTALLQFRARQAVARARRHQRHRQHPRRRRVRHALARRRPLCRQAAGA